MKIVSAPASLDERHFDVLVQGVATAEADRLLVDARHTRWVDPYGMLGLLAVGETAKRRGERPVLQLPEDAEVVSYLGRMGFFELAEEVYDIHGPARRRRAEASSS